MVQVMEFIVKLMVVYRMFVIFCFYQYRLFIYQNQDLNHRIFFVEIILVFF